MNSRRLTSAPKLWKQHCSGSSECIDRGEIGLATATCILADVADGSSTEVAAGGMSALPRERTSSGCLGRSERWPKAEVALLFNHFISAGEQRRRYVEAKRPGGLEIDDELKSGGKLYR